MNSSTAERMNINVGDRVNAMRKGRTLRGNVVSIEDRPLLSGSTMRWITLEVTNYPDMHGCRFSFMALEVEKIREALD